MQLGNKKVWISVASAILFGAAAISALGASFGMSFGYLPVFLGNTLSLEIFLLLAGLILLYDSFSMRSVSGRVKFSAVIVGFLLAFLGAFPLLNQLGMLNFLPFILQFDLTSTVLAGLLLFYSLYLLWDVYLLLRSYY